MKRLIAGAILIVCVLVGSAPVQAQICFRGSPAPKCKLFFITEVGIGHRVGKVSFPNGGYFTFEHGIMFNLDEQYAFGAANYLVYDERYSDFRGGVKVRLRRWLDHGLSVNLSTGLILWGGQFDERLPEFTGSVDLNFKDLAAFYLGLDYLRLREQDPVNGVNWHTGFRFGSYPGTVLSITAAVVGVFAAIAYQIAG